MPKRRDTLEQLRQMIALSRELIAKECQASHPKRRVRCQLEAGHQAPHRWQRRRGIVCEWIEIAAGKL